MTGRSRRVRPVGARPGGYCGLDQGAQISTTAEQAAENIGRTFGPPPA
ncbi:hypothetical protein [Actinomadura roseirufa]|nr:hypothetical protein [Actinomadura roseirufa]